MSRCMTSRGPVTERRMRKDTFLPLGTRSTSRPAHASEQQEVDGHEPARPEVSPAPGTQAARPSALAPLRKSSMGCAVTRARHEERRDSWVTRGCVVWEEVAPCLCVHRANCCYCISTLDAHRKRRVHFQGSPCPQGMSVSHPPPSRCPRTHGQVLKCPDPAVPGETRPRTRK